MNKNSPKGPAKGSARSMAFHALWRVQAQDAFADIVLDNLFKRHRPAGAEKSLAHELVFGVLRHRSYLDHYLGQVADRPLSKIERRTLLALRLGAYQLFFLSRVPQSAAVDESVSLAPSSSRGFVNAVLRSLASGEKKLQAPESIRDPAERTAAMYSHPLWMVKDWTERLGEDGAAELCRANNIKPPLSLRINGMRTGREVFIRLLSKHGIEVRPGKLSPLAVIVPDPVPVRDLPGFDDGLFQVQDEASQLPPLLLGPRPGETVLDACAAPGTKSLELAQLMEGKGRILALDVHKGRLERLLPEARRLGLDNVTTMEGDASLSLKKSLPRGFRGVLFDRVLVDAPCTGTGIIRRSPEIKWRRKPEDAYTQGELQRSILLNVAKWLKPGGVLVYSTCTFTLEENEKVISSLLETGGFEQEDPACHLPQAASVTSHKMLRTFPHLTGTDGFTVFRLRRK
ncbi:MAG: 16S rRNA (cytosine(967)-C(5))-methyltransferase RsmB [bacterium]